MLSSASPAPSTAPPDALLSAAAQAGATTPALYAAMLVALLLITASLWCLARPLRHLSPTDGHVPRPWLLLLRLAAGFAVIVGCAALFAALADATGPLEAGLPMGRLDEAFILGTIGHVPNVMMLASEGLAIIADRPAQTVFAVVGPLLLFRHRALALTWLLAIAGNGLLTTVLKQVVRRARPEHPTPDLVVNTFSFPSGHSSGAVVICGLLAYVACRFLPQRWHLPALLVAVAGAFSVGFSRLILRAHYPSDVLAGFTSGFAWLTVCLLSLETVRWYRDRRAAAPPRPLPSDDL